MTTVPFDFDLLTELTETSGVPGYEDRVRELVVRELEDSVDRVRTDAMATSSAPSTANATTRWPSRPHGRDRLYGSPRHGNG